jgi:hypothetical protein
MATTAMSITNNIYGRRMVYFKHKPTAKVHPANYMVYRSASPVAVAKAGQTFF